MAIPKVKYLRLSELRKGWSGRFAPGPAMRETGYVGFPLFLDGEPWTTAALAKRGIHSPIPATRTGRRPGLEELIEIGRAIEAIVDQQMSASQPEELPLERPQMPPSRVLRPARAITIECLFGDYFRLSNFQALAPATQRDYRQRLGHVCDWFGPDKRPSDIDSLDIREMFDREFIARGHRSAHGQFTVMRVAFRWAEQFSREWRPYIPKIDWAMNIPAPPPRIRIATPEEQAALLRAADDPLSIYREIGREARRNKRGRAVQPLAPRPSVGDVLTLMLWTVQRPTDILLLERDAIYTATEGKRLRIRPNKTGEKHHTRVDIPIYKFPPLMSRLADINRRHLERGWSGHPRVILSDTQGLPYLDADAVSTTYAKVYGHVRNLAAEICPSVTTLHTQDYRDTAMTNLAMAGCSLLEIIALSGHKSVDSVKAVIKHYISMKTGIADRSADKLLALMSQ